MQWNTILLLLLLHCQINMKKKKKKLMHRCLRETFSIFSAYTWRRLFGSTNSGEKVQMKLIKRSRKADWQASDSRAHSVWGLSYFIFSTRIRLAILSMMLLWKVKTFILDIHTFVSVISTPSPFLVHFILRPYRKFPSPHNCAILLIERNTKEVKWNKHQVNTKKNIFPRNKKK